MLYTIRKTLKNARRQLRVQSIGGYFWYPPAAASADNNIIAVLLLVLYSSTYILANLVLFCFKRLIQNQNSRKQQ